MARYHLESSITCSLNDRDSDKSRVNIRDQSVGLQFLFAFVRQVDPVPGATRGGPKSVGI